MSRHSVEVEIPAAPEKVWAVMVDVERWPEWTASVTEVRRLDSGPLAVGSRACIRQPRLLPATWEVTELDEGRRFTWVTRSPGVYVTAEHEILPAGPGSRVTLSIGFSGALGPLVARMTRNLNRRYLRLEADGLRRRSLEPA